MRFYGFRIGTRQRQAKNKDLITTNWIAPKYCGWCVTISQKQPSVSTCVEVVKPETKKNNGSCTKSCEFPF